MSSGSMSMSWSREHEREKLGWQVPVLPEGIIEFKEPLEKLKFEVLRDLMECDGGSANNSVMVVAAPGGSGKTTLVTMLCWDSHIREKFGRNIFFVTVSESPDFLLIVNDLINPYSYGLQVQFQNKEDAKNKLWNFMHENVSGPMLLVLDDVWSASFIDKFKFPSQIEGYKILITSRTAFPNYNVLPFDPLSDKDAEILFCQSAFDGCESTNSWNIEDKLVNEMIRCCKKHPLTLSVIGKSLNGKDESVWRSMLNKLSQGRSVLDLHKDVLICLERSFEELDNGLKDCFLDFGLFPEDQRIPISTLFHMWVHLYNHDENGDDTLANIFELSYRNLVNLSAKGFRKGPVETTSYHEQQFVTQHDLLRELAILLNSKLPVAQRTRLIINAQKECMRTSIQNVQEPMQARIMSISTGESFSSGWCDIKVPNVEVLVLSIMSNKYTFPHFLEEMQKLKILSATNYGLYPTDIINFNLLGYLSNLMRIRLECMAIPSSCESFLELKNLQKVSFIMCKIGNSFEELTGDHPQIWPQLLDLEIDYCQDLVKLPGIFCKCAHLKNLSVTNCNEMRGLSEEFGNLTSMETLSLHSCTILEKLPDSISSLQKLSILDISDCLSLNELPEQIGKLAGLRTIYMKGCSDIKELPPSVEKLSNTQVVCNEEVSKKWKEFPNVKIEVVDEDHLGTLMKII